MFSIFVSIKPDKCFVFFGEIVPRKSARGKQIGVPDRLKMLYAALQRAFFPSAKTDSIGQRHRILFPIRIVNELASHTY